MEIKAVVSSASTKLVCTQNMLNYSKHEYTCTCMCMGSSGVSFVDYFGYSNTFMNAYSLYFQGGVSQF